MISLKNKKNMMKALFLIFLVTGFGSCSVSSQEQGQPKGWEITCETHAVALPGATKQEKQQVKQFNDHPNWGWSKQLLTKDLLKGVRRSDSGKTYFELYNMRDSLVYTYQTDKGEATCETFEKFKQEHHLTTIPKINPHLYPNIQKKIQGMKTYKITFERYHPYTLDTVQVIQWTSNSERGFNPLRTDTEDDGLVLETAVTNNHIKKITKAVNIQQVSVKESDYHPPQEYKIRRKDK